jgi:type IV secretion system protein TrbB
MLSIEPRLRTPDEQQKDQWISKLAREMGPVLLEALAAEDSEDILINPDGKAWCKRLGKPFMRIGELRTSVVRSIINTVATIRGTVCNHDAPILETTLPLDDSRMEAVVDPVVSGPVLAIRLRPRKIFSFDDYEAAGIITHKDDPMNRPRQHRDFGAAVRGKSHRQILDMAIAARKNILAVGATAAGKTTLLNAHLDALVRIAPHDRVITIEDTMELQTKVENSVALHAFGDVTMLHCLRACMRLRPNRIIVGEVRGKEALALLKAWNTGHPGGFATVHAKSALGGLRRMESLIAEATAARHQDLIAETIDVVLLIDEEPALPAGRKLREVGLVQGYARGRYEIEYV